LAKKNKNTKEVGDLGESIASNFLISKGFSVLDRNYRKKWGEIDVVSQRGEILHFVEVKTVTREKWGSNSSENSFRPEENVHPGKIKRLSRTINSYLLEKNLEDVDWQIDLVAVVLDVENKKAHVRFLENIF